MNRILINDEWYDPVDTDATYESAFEGVVMGQAAALFPGYRAFPFKIIVESEYGSARADYALIERGYQNWWVVEVEMAHHSLPGHVAPQVLSLGSAVYGADATNYIMGKAPELERVRVQEMLRGLAPKILVVVNRPVPDWAPHLQPLGAELASFEIYRSARNRYVYRVDGFLPSAGSEQVSRCWLEPTMPFMLRIASPGSVPLANAEPIQVLWQGRVTTWKRAAARDALWLICTDRNPLDPGRQYEMACLEEGVLLFRETPHRAPYGGR